MLAPPPTNVEPSPALAITVICEVRVSTNCAGVPLKAKLGAAAGAAAAPLREKNATIGLTPAGPCGPVAPVAPVGPAGPVAPVAPVAPVGPAGPLAPSSGMVPPTTLVWLPVIALLP